MSRLNQKSRPAHIQNLNPGVFDEVIYTLLLNRLYGLFNVVPVLCPCTVVALLARGVIKANIYDQNLIRLYKDKIQDQYKNTYFMNL